jgi:hypothetical protein
VGAAGTRDPRLAATLCCRSCTTCMRARAPAARACCVPQPIHALIHPQPALLRRAEAAAKFSTFAATELKARRAEAIATQVCVCVLGGGVHPHRLLLPVCLPACLLPALLPDPLLPACLLKLRAVLTAAVFGMGCAVGHGAGVFRARSVVIPAAVWTGRACEEPEFQCWARVGGQVLMLWKAQRVLGCSAAAGSEAATMAGA